MILYVHLSFGRTEKSMDLLLLFAKKCLRVPTIALHLGSFQLPSVSRCGSFHAYFVFPIKENFGCLERIWIHGPRIFSGVFFFLQDWHPNPFFFFPQPPKDKHMFLMASSGPWEYKQVAKKGKFHAPLCWDISKNLRRNFMEIQRSLERRRWCNQFDLFTLLPVPIIVLNRKKLQMVPRAEEVSIICWMPSWRFSV